MAVIGDFTPDVETTDPNAEPDEFTCWGETFAIPATVGTGRILRFSAMLKGAMAQEQRGRANLRKALTDEFKERARAEIVEAEITANAALYDLLTSCLGADQIDAFIETGDREGATQEAYMAVCDQIQEAIAGRPTKRSADSSDGPSTTGQPSTADGPGPTDMTPRDQLAAQIEASSAPVG